VGSKSHGVSGYRCGEADAQKSGRSEMPLKSSMDRDFYLYAAAAMPGGSVFAWGLCEQVIRRPSPHNTSLKEEEEYDREFKRTRKCGKGEFFRTINGIREGSFGTCI